MYVLKRPHMDAFMAAVGAAFEVVVFTASLAKYADPLLDLLDKGHVVSDLFKSILLLSNSLDHIVHQPAPLIAFDPTCQVHLHICILFQCKEFISHTTAPVRNFQRSIWGLYC